MVVCSSRAVTQRPNKKPDNRKVCEMEKLLSYKGLADSIGLPVRTCRHLVATGVIPHLRLGHKLVVFQPSAVEKALKRREVAALAK
jgi:hypothetical protein